MRELLEKKRSKAAAAGEGVLGESQRVAFGELSPEDQKKVFEIEKAFTVRFHAETFWKDKDDVVVSYNADRPGAIPFDAKDLKKMASLKLKMFQINPIPGSITVRW